MQVSSAIRFFGKSTHGVAEKPITTIEYSVLDTEYIRPLSQHRV